MSYLDKCGILHLLTSHSKPLVSGIYADVQVRGAGYKLEHFHEIRKNDPDVERTPEVEEAYILRVTMSGICATCTTRELSFCQRNDNGFNSLYATAVYAACSQRERRLGTSLVVAENEKSFPGAVRAGREKTAKKYVEAAQRKASEFGVYDANDYVSYTSDERRLFRELSGKHSHMHLLLDEIKRILGTRDRRLLEYLDADMRTLPNGMLSDEDLRVIYRAMTEDTPVEVFEPTLTKIEAWTPAVKAFREQLKRRRR